MTRKVTCTSSILSASAQKDTVTGDWLKICICKGSVCRTQVSVA